MHVRRDIPGFVGNRLQHAMKREAIALVAAGVCDAETIDIVVKEGRARAWPCSGRWSSPIWSASISPSISPRCFIADLDRTAGPHPFLRQKVKDGKLGMKTGEGFRRWTPETPPRSASASRAFWFEQAKARKKTLA